MSLLQASDNNNYTNSVLVTACECGSNTHTSGGFRILKLGGWTWANYSLLPSLSFLSLSPISSRPPIAASGSGGALKLPQHVRAEPGRQTLFGEF